jgi:predicted 3-demethylubiquinone-9 3-methyltransferase (glyoxalase superfamily)
MDAIIPFMMFEGSAEEALTLYTAVFPRAEVASISRYGEGEEGPAGKVRHAVFTLNGQRFRCIDSTIQHAFAFTPALSLYVACETEEEVDAAHAALAEGGEVLMPLGSYPFSPRYAWLNDRFGVSWQLSLAAP